MHPEAPDKDLPKQPGQTPTPSAEPSLRSLFLSNLRVVAAALALMAMAYLLWRGLRLLFPDIAWLQAAKTP